MRFHAGVDIQWAGLHAADVTEFLENRHMTQPFSARDGRLLRNLLQVPQLKARPLFHRELQRMAAGGLKVCVVQGEVFREHFPPGTSRATPAVRRTGRVLESVPARCIPKQVFPRSRSPDLYPLPGPNPLPSHPRRRGKASRSLSEGAPFLHRPPTVQTSESIGSSRALRRADHCNSQCWKMAKFLCQKLLPNFWTRIRTPLHQIISESISESQCLGWMELWCGCGTNSTRVTFHSHLQPLPSNSTFHAFAAVHCR